MICWRVGTWEDYGDFQEDSGAVRFRKQRRRGAGRRRPESRSCRLSADWASQKGLQRPRSGPRRAIQSRTCSRPIQFRRRRRSGQSSYWKLWHVRLPGASPSQYSCLLPAELKVHCLTFTSYTCINSMPYWSIPELLYLLRSWWRIFTCIGELELCSYAMVLIHWVWSKFWVLSLVDGILELALAMCALHDMLLISRMKAFPSEARFKFLRKTHEFVFLVI